MNSATIIWAALIVVFLIIEAMTFQMLTTWFAVGASVAAVLSAFGISAGWQITAFLAVSVLCFAALRPLALKLLKNSDFKSNADALVGQKLIVTEDIDNDLGKGSGRLNGLEWSLCSANGEIIRAGTKVCVEKIQGVKLIVSVLKGED